MRFQIFVGLAGIILVACSFTSSVSRAQTSSESSRSEDSADETPRGSTPPTLHMVAQDEGSNRRCLQSAGADSETAATNVRVSGATADERDLLNRVVAKINALSSNQTSDRTANRTFSRLRGLRVVFLNYLDRDGCLASSQARGYIEIGRHCPPGSDRDENFVQESGSGLLAHEIGHHVGNVGRGYIGYPKGCHITGYTMHNASGEAHPRNLQLHEEFAEVFAAYVLNPSLIQNTPGCGPALRHMQGLFGGTGATTSCQGSSQIQPPNAARPGARPRTADAALMRSLPRRLTNPDTAAQRPPTKSSQHAVQ